MKSELLQKYISGEVTEAEKRQVTEWIEESEEHLREYMSMRKLHDIALWRTEAVSSQASETKPRRFTLRRIGVECIKIAAVVLLAFIIGRTWTGQKTETLLQTIYVPAGQRAEVTLADGTRVWLNSKSKLVFPSGFEGDIRQVELDGEAYFTVARNEHQPFIVQTPKHDIRVLGTEFNVLAYSQDSIWETALLKGKVEILPLHHRNGKSIVMAPNTRVTQKGNGWSQGSIKEPDHYRWREGLICFTDISVGGLLQKLELYFDVRFIINNQRIQKNRYSGKFRTTDGVEHVLRVLKLNNRFSYVRDDENNTITIN